MTFDKSQWISEMIGGSITGAIAGMIGAIFLPDPPFAVAVAAGGAAGLATGLVSLPLKVFLDWRPRSQASKSARSSAAKTVENKPSSMKKSQQREAS